MAAFALTDPEIYVGAFDLSCDLNKIDGSYNPNFLDATTFCSAGWRARVAGLNDVDFSVEGFNDFATTGVDASTYPLLGTINVVTVSLTGNGAVGEPAYLFQSLHVGAAHGATVGELATFSGAHKGKSQMVSGKMGVERVSRTATASSSGVQLGTASSGQLFATRHVFSRSGNSPTLATFIQSATNSSFIGAVTRAHFTTASAVGGEWVSASVAATSGTWWRFSWTIGGTGTPTFDFAGAFSIR